MTEQRSFLANLMWRRVPQIVGIYIAATWLVIELGDWVTERFALPTNLTSYVFVVMLAMLPAIILFAYNHGAPGKDRWTKAEKIAIPLNVLATLVILYLVGPSLTVEAAIETVSIPDETGVVREFEVARQGYHREAISFFWRNDSSNTDLDWLSYGIPLMLAHDLSRVSPVITVQTPFDSGSVREELKRRGYDSLLGEPQGLSLDIARDRRSAVLIVGSFAAEGDTLSVSATLIDVESGRELATHTIDGMDWLRTVDELTAMILDDLDVTPSDNQTDDPIGQHFSDSLDAIRHFTNAMVELDINNDYPRGIAELQQAVTIDPLFAEAFRELSSTHYFNGDIDAARSAASNALRNSYRLSETSKFVVKANRYIFDGDYDRGERVIDIWTQVQPNSTEAFEVQAFLATLRGGEEALQKAGAAYDRLLELDPSNLGIYRQKANLELQRGDYGAAARYLQNYLDREPDSGDALIELASVYQAQGDLDAAQAALEDAVILSDSPLASELGLARLEARRGSYESAERRLMAQLEDDLSQQQRIQILGARTEIALLRGRVQKAAELQEAVGEAAKSLLPPMVRLVNIENQRANILALLGRRAEALAIADEITAQLQPPLDTYMNFTYTAIYRELDERDAFRSWAEKTRASRDQLPEVFEPFIEIESAQIAVWDGDSDAAIAHLDRARELLGQSFIKTIQDNLSTYFVHAGVAELYLEAGAIDKAQSHLDGALRVFPDFAFAKLVAARIRLAQGDEPAARALLAEALATWSSADDDYTHRQRASRLLAEI